MILWYNTIGMRALTSDLILLEKMEKNGSWFSSHYKEIVEKYKNEFIAIEDAEIIAHNPRLDALLEELKKKGKNLSEILIEFVAEKGTKFIL